MRIYTHKHIRTYNCIYNCVYTPKYRSHMYAQRLLAPPILYVYPRPCFINPSLTLSYHRRCCCCCSSVVAHVQAHTVGQEEVQHIYTVWFLYIHVLGRALPSAHLHCRRIAIAWPVYRGKGWVRDGGVRIMTVSSVRQHIYTIHLCIQYGAYIHHIHYTAHTIQTYLWHMFPQPVVHKGHYLCVL